MKKLILTLVLGSSTAASFAASMPLLGLVCLMALVGLWKGVRGLA